MKLQILKGTTSKRLAIFVQDSSQTDGRGLSGLVWNTASLAWYYWREDEGNAAATLVTLATMTRGTWATGGFVEKDATNMPGFYEIGIPNAALATGAHWVVMRLGGAANMAPVTLEIELTNLNNQDGVRAGLTALPNAAADAAGGLPISDAGGLDLDTQIGTDIDAILVDTAVIGAAGAGLTGIPWNGASWDAEVESECNDALVALRLDHLVAVADADDAVNDSIIAKLASKAATADWSTFVNTTESLEALRDRGDAAWITATGFSTLSQADIRTAVGLAGANLDTQLGDIPTVAEFNARTLVAAAYFDPAVDAVIVGTNNDKTGYTLTVTPPTAAQNADAVLDEAAAGHAGFLTTLALEATLTAIKGAGWSTETLKAIKDAVDPGVSAPTTAQIVTALKASTGWTAVGTETFATIVKALRAAARGKITVAAGVYTVYDDDGTTALFTFTPSTGATTRAVT